MVNKFFSEKLNYSLANEDTRLEIEILKRVPKKNILAVSGSGSRAISLANSNTESLTVFDMSPVQIDLAKLRVETILNLSYDDFLLFWGYPPFGDETFEAKRKILSGNVIGGEGVYNDDSSPLIYRGRWERTFQTFSKVAKKILGRKNIEKLLCADDIEKQKEIFFSIEFRARWLLLVFILGNRAVFNALLYKGNFVKKNRPESYFEFYKKRFDHNFKNNLFKQNFFLQLCLCGEIAHVNGNIPEATHEVFHSVKASLLKMKNVLKFDEKSLDGVIETYDQKFDFVSLSDIDSYFFGELEKNYFQRMKKILKPGAIVVTRHYLRTPENCDKSGYVDITNNFRDLIEHELVQVYDIEILEFKG